MTLQELIKSGKLEKFKLPIAGIRKRFEKGKARLVFAQESFKKNTPEEHYAPIFTNIYDSVRIIGEAYLLLNGYRAKLKEHHKTVINVTREFMKKEEDMKNVMSRLNKMRKQRNDIDYDFEACELSRTRIEKAIEDAGKFADKVWEAIRKKDPQQQIL